MFIKQTGNTNATIRIIWLHGWGQNHQAFNQLSHLFSQETDNYFLDLPGFGQTAPPTSVWGTLEYTQEILNWLQQLPTKQTFIVGHSFGARLAIQAAKLQPPSLAGIILIAAAGLPRKRSIFFTIKAITLIGLAKSLRFIDNYCHTKLRQYFNNYFGSNDYKATSGIMRNILVKVIHEDLTTIAQQITLPTLLIYGENDTETPIELGRRLQKLIKTAKFFALPGFDHNSILSLGKHQVYHLIRQFLEKGHNIC